MSGGSAVMNLRFGIEVEVGGGSAGVLERLGLDGLHGYHCDCFRCDPHRLEPAWTAQEDCTAEGEFISRILTYGTPEAVEAIEALGNALAESRAQAGFDGHAISAHDPNVNAEQGVHVHVESVDMDSEAVVLFWRLWFRYQDDIGKLAAGRWDEVRDYNRPVRFDEVVGEHIPGRTPCFWRGNPSDVYALIGSPYLRTCWVNPHTGKGTWEFRLWNTTRATWRLHLAVGVSVACMAAAMDGVRVRKTDTRTLFEVIGPYMDDQSAAAYLRAAIIEERAS